MERHALHVDFSLTMSFLELEGLHVFVRGAGGGIGSAIVDEFLGRCELKS
jgi:FlaA1/EpsC-like NDP-sugar epimerase